MVPYGGLFGEFFAIFGGFFAKSGSDYAKIDKNEAVFVDFEKGAVVFALSWGFDHETHGDHEEGKILDRINRIDFCHELH